MLLAIETSGDGVRMHLPITRCAGARIGECQPVPALLSCPIVMVEGGWVFKIDTVDKLARPQA